MAERVADVGYGVKVRQNWDANVNLSYTRNTFLIEQFPNIARDSDEFVVELTNTIKPTDRDQLTVGTLVNRIRGQETYFGLGFPLTISNGNRAGSAAYVQLDHRLVSTVKLIGGFQANKIQDVDFNVVPRAGVIWSPVSRINVKALYGQAFRAPSINETTLDHPGLAGTLGLRPEKVATFDLGLGYQGERLQTGVKRGERLRRDAQSGT
jgi:outer membrane receptor protein involved in Fe transport